MERVVLVRRFGSPPVDQKEILRYAGASESTAELSALLADCLAEAEAVLRYETCYCFFPLAKLDGRLSLGFAETDSKTAMRALEGCDGILLLAATLGHGFDRLLAKYTRLSPARALLLQAVGAERIEALCDLLEETVAEENPCFTFRPRFSPGYGDLPLSMQKDVFSALSLPKHLGLALNESMLVSPSKTVTAIIGLKKGM